MLTKSVFTPNFPSAAIASEWPYSAAHMRAVLPYDCEDARRGETGRRETEGSSELRDKKSTTGEHHD